MARKNIEEIIEPHHNNRRSPSLAAAFPEVALEWCYDRNCGFGPEDFSYGSNVSAWWQCSWDARHIWRAQICKRSLDGRDCPYCFGKNLRNTPVIEERSLAFSFPELAVQWHKTKNGSLRPEDVLAGSNRKVWWQCDKKKKHAWLASIKMRAKGHGCHHCYHERRLDLRDFPEVLKLFDRKKNRWLDHRKLSTTWVLWWRCPAGPDHSWQSRFNKKSLLCPCCRNHKLSVTNSLASLYPKVAKQLHPTRNGGLTVDKVKAFWCKRLWWRCTYNPRHIWQASVNNRTRNESGCPECYKARKSQIAKAAAARKKQLA